MMFNSRRFSQVAVSPMNKENDVRKSINTFAKVMLRLAKQ